MLLGDDVQRVLERSHHSTPPLHAHAGIVTQDPHDPEAAIEGRWLYVGIMGIVQHMCAGQAYKVNAL